MTFQRWVGFSYSGIGDRGKGMQMRKLLEISHGGGMPKECWPVWLLYRMLKLNNGEKAGE